ncbi:MAG: class I SAM-dependent methyltransferase [Isosphaeraceae bacterium]|nr:class I SAM-dependent methyltransferase [Isosphaeraceae bacterium]
MPSALKAARAWIARALPSGGIAVDATAGLGRDTLFLARRVGPTGRVVAFDIQPAALAAAAARIQAARLEERVSFVLAGHETLDAHVSSFHAVMFNLGFLPRSDKRIITRPDTTLAALECAIVRLEPAGAITIVAYPGHPGGAEECAAVEDRLRRLAAREFEVACYRRLTPRAAEPTLFALRRR